MKKLLSIIILVCLCFFSSACSDVTTSSAPQKQTTTITDVFGTTEELSTDSRIAVCYGSFAECLKLSGKEPVAVTNDAVEEHKLTFSNDVILLGKNKEINLENLIASDPDYVILSADLSAQIKLKTSLEQASIKHGFFRVDTFGDYKDFMSMLCKLTGRNDLYRKNVLETEERIKTILKKIPENTEKTALLMRVFSTGIKAKTDDNLAGQILKEFGLTNIADNHPSLLEDLSLEQIVTDNPDYIFATTMGSEKNALEYLNQNAISNPAWQELSAVKNNRYVLLPKDLFHYKPNNRWDKAYEYMAKIIFPEIFYE